MAGADQAIARRNRRLYALSECLVAKALSRARRAGEAGAVRHRIKKRRINYDKC